MDKAEARRRVQELLRGLKETGRLSRKDAEAVRIALAEDNESRERHTSIVNTSAFKKKIESEDQIRMCLDFGTAMSKAWATKRSVADTVPLVIGTQAGLKDQLAVPSSIFISQSGRIYLGADAETQHRQEIHATRSRFDNLKRMLSEAEPGQELDDVPLPSTVDPTNSGLSKGDLLVLYLGWLTDLALTTLQATLTIGGKPMTTNIGRLGHVKRRFAISCFAEADDDPHGAKRAKWARGVMERALMRAQLVADTFHGRWSELTAADAKLILDEVRRTNVKPLSRLLTRNCAIREPIAAGASRFEEELAELVGLTTPDDRGPTRYMMVIDAGAGTTDFAVFQVFQDPHQNLVRFGLISSTVRMSRAAGNEVDASLRPLILEACRIDPITGSPRSKEDFALISNDLDAQVRDYKQQLFARGEIEISLRPNVRGHLILNTLLQDPSFRSLGQQLTEMRRSILTNLFPQDFLERVSLANERFGQAMPLYVLLTGGSSSLPIVQILAEGQIEIKGAKFQFLHVKDSPKWITRLPRDAAELIRRAYPQCAVAIGGSVPKLPREIEDLTRPVTPARPGRRKLQRYQVTGVG